MIDLADPDESTPCLGQLKETPAAAGSSPGTWSSTQTGPYPHLYQKAAAKASAWHKENDGHYPIP
jgi:hypothetical protein